MHSELTNLLPPKRQRALARAYLLRLSVIVAVLVSALALIAAVLLLPTYVFLLKSMGTKEAHLKSIESALSSADERELSTRLSALTKNASVLTALAGAPSVSALLRDLLSVPRPGITLSGFSYAPTTGDTSGTFALSGSAATRDALRGYQLALQNAPRVAAASLPVSAYAKDANISFTVTITLAP